MKWLRYLLFPFTLLYVLITGLRNWFFKVGILRAKQYDMPVICVGNLSTGGTGKSPMVDYLLKLLSVKYKPASLSRGYGRTTKGFIDVATTHTAAAVGDEPLMLKLANPQVPVCVDENRVAGIDKIRAAYPQVQAIVLDDAFQHRYVKAGLNIMLSTWHKPFYRDYVLPMGNLRELRKNAARAQVVVITKCPDLTAVQQEAICRQVKKYTPAQVFFAGIDYGPLQPLFNSPATPVITGKALVVTGIASGSQLVGHVQQTLPAVEHMPFADHYAYKAADFTAIAEKFNSFANPGGAIITTHKDAVKWMAADEQSVQTLKNLPVYYQPMQMVILDNATGFNTIIENYVGSIAANR